MATRRGVSSIPMDMLSIGGCGVELVFNEDGEAGKNELELREIMTHTDMLNLSKKDILIH